MSRSQATGIQVWFWARDDPFVPPEICHGAQKGQAVFPSIAWGEPVANFPMLPGYCDYASHINAQRIVFDLTFCVSGLFFASPLLFWRVRWLILHRVIGLAMFGPSLAVSPARAPALTVSTHSGYYIN